MPGTPGAELVSESSAIKGAILGDPSALGSGGMRSKVLAAEMAAAAGIPTVIAGGLGESVLEPVLAGEPRGTRFHATGQELPAYKLWLRFGKPVAGRLHLDEGAARTVARRGGSVPAVGVVSCQGTFEAGEAVELVGPDGIAFGKGMASVRADELAGRPRGVEAVHRDRLVLYE